MDRYGCRKRSLEKGNWMISRQHLDEEKGKSTFTDVHEL